MQLERVFDDETQLYSQRSMLALPRTRGELTAPGAALFPHYNRSGAAFFCSGFYRGDRLENSSHHGINSAIGL
jgi:hypothetical protein